MTNLTTMNGQLHFSQREKNVSGTTVARITDLSLFGVTDVKLGRWVAAEDGSGNSHRKIEVTYRDGRKAEMNLFREGVRP